MSLQKKLAPTSLFSTQVWIAGVLSLTSWLAIAPPGYTTAMPQATAAARVEQQQQQRQQVQPENYDLSRYPVTDANERHWRNMLWTTAIVEPQEAFVSEAIARILTLTPRPDLSDAQQRTVEMALQIATQLYLSDPAGHADLAAQFLQTLESSPEADWVAMALSALVRGGMESEQQRQWRDRLRQRFPQWVETMPLFTTLRELAFMERPPAPPPLADLLNWTIAPGEMQIYVLCRPDRGILCQAIVKDGNGQFVRQNGQLWSVPLGLRSLHSLSWNFTRGQTPQGVYRIEGVRPADLTTFRAYGQFSLVKLFAPYEDGVQSFLPGQPGAFTGGVSAYQSLLPPSWRNYFPMQQSYWAGKAGRGLFRIHGSGDDPTFFSSNSRYPASTGWNPSIGCLSALELYDAAGQLQQADMPLILDTLTRLGGQNVTGYLLVVEVPDASGQPISLEDIEEAIAPPPEAQP